MAWELFCRNSQLIDSVIAVNTAKHILEHGPITDMEFDELSGPSNIGNEFLAKNVFAINSEGFYDFDNKMTEYAVRSFLRAGDEISPLE